MRKQYLPLFISFKYYIIPCWLFVITLILVQYLCQKSGMNVFPIFNVWLILKIAVVIFNGNYIRRCTKKEYDLWQQRNGEQEVYFEISLKKKIKDTLLVTNIITSIILMLRIVYLLLDNIIN